jgi:hypothetical protein
MFTEEQLQQFPNGMEYQLRKLNAAILERLGQRIKDIGELLPSDAHRLEQLKDYGADVDDIAAELARITHRNTPEIYEIFDAVAAENVAFSARFYKARGKKFIPYAENTELQRFVGAMAKQTAGEYVNLSQSTGFMLRNSVTGQKELTSLSRTYQQVIDRAVTAVSTGVSDYQSETRSLLRELADSGLRTQYANPKGSAGKVVDYVSGYYRRLDSSVRQNLLWGVKTCNQSVTAAVGTDFGADGYEVDYHRNPRPTHAEMGGRQYAMGEARTVDGKYYPSFSEAEVLLSEYGCLHFYFPIILGISSPAYSDEQLAKFKAQDEKIFEFEGKTYTGYEAKQMQRKLETAIRNAQDRQIIAKAAGDDTLAMQEQLRINQLTSKYKEFSDTAGLSTKMERARVSGYHKIMTLPKVAKESNMSC